MTSSGSVRRFVGSILQYASSWGSKSHGTVQVGMHGPCVFYVERIAGENQKHIPSISGRGRRGDELRRVKVNVLPEEYDPELIGPEWSAWLSYQREHPPTDEEIQKNRLDLKRRLENAAKLEAEELKRRSLPSKDPDSLHINDMHHNKRFNNGPQLKPEVSNLHTWSFADDPLSVDGDFQPASWKP
eukprot:gene1939-5028_t